jgi:hypothetical protein
MSATQEGGFTLAGAAALTAVAMGAATLVSWVVGPPWLCQRVAAITEFHPGGCDDSTKHLDVDQAGRFLAEFYPRVGGADPGGAWPMLSAPMREAVGEERFLESWREVVFAELEGTPVPEGRFNTFEVVSRHYHEDGRVVRRHHVHVLQFEGEHVRIHATLTSQNAPGEALRRREPYPRVQLVADGGHTFQLPSTDANPAALPDDLSVGGHLEALCQFEAVGEVGVASEVEGSRWWTRTPLGWIPNAWLDLDGLPHDDLLECDGSHARRVAAAGS